MVTKLNKIFDFFKSKITSKSDPLDPFGTEKKYAQSEPNLANLKTTPFGTSQKPVSTQTPKTAKTITTSTPTNTTGTATGSTFGSRLGGGLASTAKTAAIAGGATFGVAALADAISKMTINIPEPEPQNPDPTDPDHIIDPWVEQQDPLYVTGGGGDGIMDWIYDLFGGGTVDLSGGGDIGEPSQGSSWTSYLPYILVGIVGLVVVLAITKPKTKGKKKK